jgi:hypothetical protein
MAPIRKTGTEKAVARSMSKKERADKAKSLSSRQLSQAASKAASKAARRAAHKKRLRLAGEALVEWHLTGSALLPFEAMAATACAVEAPDGVNPKWWRLVFDSAATALWGIVHRGDKSIGQELTMFTNMLGRDPLTLDVLDVLTEFTAAAAQ